MAIKKVKSFVIDRGKWLNGKVVRKAPGYCGDGVLLEPESGLMCCLGIYARACGVPATMLENKGMPDDVTGQAREKVYDLFKDIEVNALANRNDNAARERGIADGFRKGGVRVTFKGKAEKAIAELNKAFPVED